MAPDPETVGQAPTTRTDNLELAAAELAPHLSLQRIEASAKFVLATVGAVGGLLTGLGALGSTPAADHPAWALPSLLCVALSVAAAAWALVGSSDDVQVDDLEDVEYFYGQQIKRRGRLVRWAGALLAVALLLAVLPSIRAATSDSETPAAEVHAGHT